jgi:hypothetical protein
MNRRTIVKCVFLGIILLGTAANLICAEASKEPLVAALSFPSEIVCSAASAQEIVANIAFTNQSAGNILLKTAAGRNVTIHGLFRTRTLKPLLSSWMSMSDRGAGYTSSDIVLHPSETRNYQARFKLPPELLSEPGFYKVQVSYSILDDGAQPAGVEGTTNWAIFQVRNCDR